MVVVQQTEGLPAQVEPVQLQLHRRRPEPQTAQLQMIGQTTFHRRYSQVTRQQPRDGRYQPACAGAAPPQPGDAGRYQQQAAQNHQQGDAPPPAYHTNPTLICTR